MNSPRDDFETNDEEQARLFELDNTYIDEPEGSDWRDLV